MVELKEWMRLNKEDRAKDESAFVGLRIITYQGTWINSAGDEFEWCIDKDQELCFYFLDVNGSRIYPKIPVEFLRDLFNNFPEILDPLQAP